MKSEVRKGYIEIADEYIKFSDMYRLRKFLWNEIHSVGIYYLNGNTILGIAINKNLIHHRSL